MRGVDKRGQVWVETVIYTLIGLAIIGLVLAAALPKINETKDKVAIEQSIEGLGLIDDKITEVVNKGVGNRRVVDLEIKKGVLTIDPINDAIRWTLDSDYAYSQPGTTVSLGRLNVTTKEGGSPLEVVLELNYGFDIMYESDDSFPKDLSSAAVPYVFSIENVKNDDGLLAVKISVK